MTDHPNHGVLLMTYGSPRSLEREAVAAYLATVRGGRDADPALVEEFTRRYRVIGGSPLIEITRAQAAALERSLGWPVEVGMRFSEPTILDALSSLADRGVSDVTGIVLSPQYSALLMDGYRSALEGAAGALGPLAPYVRVAGAWHEQPAFIEAIASRVTTALERWPRPERAAVRVLMTAHSLPRRVAASDPGYLAQLRETAQAVAEAADLERSRWTFCWQSAGHEPGEWMRPDFADLMPEIGRSPTPAVLVAPIQFLADHLEILYDVDIGAREQAETHGVTFARIGSLNADPALIGALAAVAVEAASVPVGARQADRPHV